jgi:hypothetical protein
VLIAIASVAVAGCAAAAIGNKFSAVDLRLAPFDRHRLLMAVIAAGVAATLVARRRASERAEARRSWLAALPVRGSRARWESLAIASAPAWVMLVAVPFIAVPAPRLALTLLGGILAGTVVGYVTPEAKVLDLPPGSRYVPHRRVAAKDPTPSLAALGLWPIRRLFASLRPQAVTRAAIPLLLAIPLGAAADTAMLLIGILASLAATAILVTTILVVSKAAGRWLAPLPLRSARLARQVLMRPVTVILVLAAVMGWLLWVFGLTAGESAQRGLVLFLLAAAIAVSGSRLLIDRAGRGGK